MSLIIAMFFSLCAARCCSEDEEKPIPDMPAAQISRTKVDWYVNLNFGMALGARRLRFGNRQGLLVLPRFGCFSSSADELHDVEDRKLPIRGFGTLDRLRAAAADLRNT